MRLKHTVSLLLALLLIAALALPIFAAPEQNEAATTTNAAEESTEDRVFAEEDIQAMISSAIAGLQTETTAEIMPFNGQQADAAPLNNLLVENYIPFAALGLSGFALLLSIIALAKTRKKTAPNATGNYQKYF